MRISVVILAGLTVAGQYGSDGDSSGVIDASLPSSEEYSVDGVSGSTGVSAGADVNGSLDTCIRSCACSCAAQRGQDASASGEESLNAYLGSCGSLPDAGLPNDSLPDVPSGYVYAIGVHRNALIYSANDVVYTNLVDENSQPVTYYETVDVDHPFMIDGWLWNSTNDLLTIPGREAINACLEYEEGTWEKLAIDIVLKQLSPTGSCPINPGTYNMYKDFQVIETFDEMMSCNDYTALLYAVNSKGQTAFQMAYKFNVDEGQCASD